MQLLESIWCICTHQAHVLICIYTRVESAHQRNELAVGAIKRCIVMVIAPADERASEREKGHAPAPHSAASHGAGPAAARSIGGVRGAARSNQRPNSRAITKQSTTRKNHVYASLTRSSAEKRESARRPSLRNKIAIKIKRKNASSRARLRCESEVRALALLRAACYLLRAIIYGRLGPVMVLSLSRLKFSLPACH